MLPTNLLPFDLENQHSIDEKAEITSQLSDGALIKIQQNRVEINNLLEV